MMLSRLKKATIRQPTVHNFDMEIEQWKVSNMVNATDITHIGQALLLQGAVNCSHDTLLSPVTGSHERVPKRRSFSLGPGNDPHGRGARKSRQGLTRRARSSIGGRPLTEQGARGRGRQAHCRARRRSGRRIGVEMV